MKSNSILSYLSLYDKSPFSCYVNEALSRIASDHPELACAFTIGHTVQGNPIVAMRIGHGPIKIMLHATHHAREAITTILLLDQINYLISLAEQDVQIEHIRIACLLEELSFYFVPLVNPDGADLALSDPEYEAWKANIRGVDLNENYPTSYPSDFLTEAPGPNGFPGACPFSEPETAALKQLTEQEDFAGTISYHSSGEEIYWYYNQNDLDRDETIAKEIAELTGYELLPASAPAHGSGYKDWFIECYHRPSLTIEVAPYVGDRPVPASDYKRIWSRNQLVPIIFGYMVASYL